MLISVILYSLVMIVVVSPVYLLLASFSLEHHSKRYGASPVALKEFLEGLHFPLEFFFVNPHFNMFTATSGKTPEEHLASTSNRSEIARSIVAMLALIIIAIWVIGLFSQSEIKWIARDMIFIFANLIGLFVTWRFGKKLKYMTDA